MTADTATGDEWSPDEPLGTETFDQGDDAIAEAARLDPDFLDELQQDPELDPDRQVDDRELEELGADLDDPEQEATLDGLMDDPDGLGGPGPRTALRRQDAEGWELDTPLVSGATDETAESGTADQD